jgi:hypothetical protein
MKRICLAIAILLVCAGVASADKKVEKKGEKSVSVHKHKYHHHGHHGTINKQDKKEVTSKKVATKSVEYKFYGKKHHHGTKCHKYYKHHHHWARCRCVHKHHRHHKWF